MYSDHGTGRGTAQLVTDVVSQIGRILRKEAALAKAEVGENLSRAGLAIGLLVGAVVLGLVALGVLAGAGVSALVAIGWAIHWAALAVGGGIVLLAAILAAKGIHDLKPKRLMPSRSIANVKQDVALMKEQINA
ncbi:phage holin family protein [Gymnodinialimonas hymeniacidonis]|uniref:phage holin family protein n=1 Tax=Gymnodinialimonas hymeniacidonis TaxID=3126508 RepID=UPI0034C679AF